MLLSKPTLERRLKALTHPHRVQAVHAFAEPRGRVASPSEIAEEIGVPVDRLGYHVRALVEAGWLELVDERDKRGLVEHLYRVVEHPFYDDGAWRELSADERQVVTEHIVASIMADLATAAAAGTLDSRLDRHVSRSPIVIDDRGWRELETMMNELLEHAQQAAAATANRVASGETPGDELVSARLAMLLFEGAPERRAGRRTVSLHERTTPEIAAAVKQTGVEQRFKGLSHPYRIRILDALARPVGRLASMSEIAEEIGVPVEDMHYHFKALVRGGWLERGGERKKQGTIERLYRVIYLPLYNSESWPALSDDERQAITAHGVGLIFADVAAAADAGTLDSRLDRHLSRVPLMLDDRAWVEVEAQMTRLLLHAATVEAESARRVLSGETPRDELVPARLALLLFEGAPRRGPLKKTPW